MSCSHKNIDTLPLSIAGQIQTQIKHSDKTSWALPRAGKNNSLLPAVLAPVTVSACQRIPEKPGLKSLRALLPLSYTYSAQESTVKRLQAEPARGTSIVQLVDISGGFGPSSHKRAGDIHLAADTRGGDFPVHQQAALLRAWH